MPASTPLAPQAEPPPTFTPAPTDATFSMETPTLAPPTPEKEISLSVLQTGQRSAMAYHDGLQKIVLVNGGPERGILRFEKLF